MSPLLIAGLLASIYVSALVTPLNQAIVFDSDSASGVAVVSGLQSNNVPYVAYSWSASLAFSTLPLYERSTANFSLIILGSGVVQFTSTQWNQIYDYQEATGARLVSLYDVPGQLTSAGYTSFVGYTSLQGNFVSPASAVGSTDVGLPASYTASLDGMGNSLLANIVNTTAVTPVLNFQNANGQQTGVAAAIYSFSQNRQQLSFFYQIASWALAPGANLPLSKYTIDILIKWGSKGVFPAIGPVVVPPPLEVPVTQAVVFGLFSTLFIQVLIIQSAHAFSGSDTASASAAINGLAAYQIPFIAYTTSKSIASSTLPLYAEATANFSMIILGSGIIGFSADQWKQLYAYQEATGARLVSLYDEPGKGAAAQYTSESLETSGQYYIEPSIYTPVTIGTTNAGLPSSYRIVLDTAAFGYIYPGSINGASIIAEKVLVFRNVASPNGWSNFDAAAISYKFSTNREQLSFFYQIAAWDT
ncbi:UNVERIFIED_CONTAM: hypothetical protein HDU68_005806, partial [Siphonaria sp. JEL0065]